MKNQDRFDSRNGGVTAVARAIEILRALGESSGGMTLAEIAEQSGLPRSTVHRITQTLQEANFVTGSGRNGGLRLGPEIARLAAISRSQLVPLVRPYLEQLSRTLGEGVSLGVIDGENVRFLDQAVSGAGIRAMTVIGSTFPTYCTAIGKALLAALTEPAMRAAMPRRLSRLTPNTIVSREELFAEIARVRTVGTAYDREEHAEGICALARVIHDSAGNLAAISVAMLAQRFYGREEELTARVTETTAKINAALAYSA